MSDTESVSSEDTNDEVLDEEELYNILEDIDFDELIKLYDFIVEWRKYDGREYLCDQLPYPDLCEFIINQYHIVNKTEYTR